MIDREMKVRVRRWEILDAFAILMFRFDDDKVQLLEGSIKEYEHNPVADESYSGITISYDQAQKLIDEFWTLGLRPTEGTGSAGAMAAAQENLKDLRSVKDKLFALLEKVDLGK